MLGSKKWDYINGRPRLKGPLYPAAKARKPMKRRMRMAFTKDKIGYRVANENDIADGKTCINCVWHHEFGGRYFCEYLGFSPRDEIEMKGTCDRVELGK